MVDTSNFVNHFDLGAEGTSIVSGNWTGNAETVGMENGIFSVSNILPLEVVDALKRELASNAWQAVGLDGKADVPYTEIGNYRLSNYNEAMAANIWTRIQNFFAMCYSMNPYTPTDHDNYPLWKPVGVSPLFRYIRYAEGGQLVAHYDETYIQDDTHRTLMSLVIYLTSNEHGATRFLVDPQANKRMDEMDFSDWDRPGTPDEVSMAIKPVAGTGLIFPHRLLHDSEPLGLDDPEKIIIRTDIMFEKG